jgi:hypothetical protein
VGSNHIVCKHFTAWTRRHQSMSGISNFERVFHQSLSSLPCQMSASYKPYVDSAG